MAVLIQINGENAGEAIKELSALAAGINGFSAAPVQEEIKPPRKRTVAEKPAAAAADEQKGGQDPMGTSEAQSGQDDNNDERPIPTIVELRAKAQEVGSTPEAKKAIKTLLDEFDSKSISDLPEDKRRAFMSRLAGLV
ncbi:hypothetical protein GCM10023310_00580 [Paenibacillus vulneris]|uniref:Uncharacterized protein n=1 Tax=Paenibacillus vulneris TaxID=1133364 RepID=A0ABW3V115_9BACL